MLKNESHRCNEIYSSHTVVLLGLIGMNAGVVLEFEDPETYTNFESAPTNVFLIHSRLKKYSK